MPIQTQWEIYGQIKVPCNESNYNTTVEFKFGSTAFDFFLEAYLSRQSPFSSEYDIDICYFGSLENKHLQDEGSIVLGTNFMSMVYTVFDLANEEISIANRNWNYTDGGNDIVEITKGSNAVPLDDGNENKDGKSSGSRFGRASGVSALLTVIAILCLLV